MDIDDNIIVLVMNYNNTERGKDRFGTILSLSGNYRRLLYIRAYTRLEKKLMRMLVVRSSRLRTKAHRFLRNNSGRNTHSEFEERERERERKKIVNKLTESPAVTTKVCVCPSDNTVKITSVVACS